MAHKPDGAAIRLPVFLWREVLSHLRRRGAGRRESGAFLLAPQDGDARITSFICYDDLDPNAYQSGAIAFHAAGCAALWQHCREKNLQILADVHTHPGSNVHQSHIDQQNPMIPVPGHTAMIAPAFGNTHWWSLKGVGVYEYLGNFKWRAHTSTGKSRRIKLTLW